MSSATATDVKGEALKPGALYAPSKIQKRPVQNLHIIPSAPPPPYVADDERKEPIDEQPKHNSSRYNLLDDLVNDLRPIMEDCNLIFAIDATGSNKWNGKKTFGDKSLHDLTEENFYQSVIKSSSSLFKLDRDGLLHLFFFGSVQATNASGVGGARFIGHYKTPTDMLNAYANLIPHEVLSGPTTFSNIIAQAVNIVAAAKQFHVLVIITDGAVDKNYIQHDYKAIADASRHPLAIICIGVGDGPWNQMIAFDDNLPPGAVFDNFQFVNYNDILACYPDQRSRQDALFLEAFQEVPQQYADIQAKLGYRCG
jgi:E3 ubiquitin-protein ligase RGLG